MSRPPSEGLEAIWRTFEGMVLDPSAPQAQRDCMKTAFVAGAWMILSTLKEMAGCKAREERSWVMYLDRLRKDCERYTAALMAKNPGGG